MVSTFYVLRNLGLAQVCEDILYVIFQIPYYFTFHMLLCNSSEIDFYFLCEVMLKVHFPCRCPVYVTLFREKTLLCCYSVVPH